MRSVILSAAVAASLASLAAAVAVASGNITSSGSTARIFLDDDLNGQGSYVASIVNACSDRTVYAIQCTSAGNALGREICGPAAPTVTVTEGPSQFIASYVTETGTLGHDAKLTISESCRLKGTTEADCVAAATIEIDGSATGSSSSTVLTGSHVHFYNVPITAGAEKTASATGACTPNAAAGSSLSVVKVMAAALAAGFLGVLAF
ncbi:0d6956e4-4939-419c-9fc6-a41f88a069f6 [Thermothielavioides terrestris]|uniref:GPI anchored cell wall protein n=2 Tax=Thermothielavioides terrestris TaxID=2587410 RepID=G2RB94_THETT|nr:uncharacterized protein THITE_2119063 [Thermothielavioides terrestris NRRL 8126]AEO69065.1 hypothetical protein THITE_2119063 [Thermothielavioides terrestris NRRL 8126]SPQ22651.1 0d6956e4-4939-419c-9fc6-a41f88a069f6 [Thermothielavioides terrestris]